MTFSYSAGVITQTGTDTDLSGLTGLTGVTTESNSQTNYRLSNTTLVIDGTLSFDAGTERITFENNATTAVDLINVGSAGTLTVTATLVNSDPRPELLAIDFGEVDIAFTNTEALVVNGTANLSGTYASVDSTDGSGRLGTVNSSGTLNFTDGYWLHYAPNKRSVQFGGTGTVNASDFTFNGLVLNAGSATFINNFTDYTFRDSSEPFVLYANNGDRLTTTSNLGGENNDKLFRIRAAGTYSACIDITNVVGGSSLVAAQSLDVATAFAYLIIRQDVNYSFLDTSGSAVTTAKIYGKDVDNGSRFAAFTVLGTNFDFSGDQIYSNTGATANITVLLQVRKGETTTGSTNTWNVVDNRGTADGEIVPFASIDYDKLIAQLQDYTTGETADNITVIMIDDASITESNKATVDAYTEIETPQKFYDRAKADLYDNYAGETSTTVTRSGAVIQAGAQNIVIDATAASVYDLTGSTITIKASAYTGGFETSGTITQSNGATIASLALSGGATWDAVQTTWTGSAGATETIDVQATGTYDATGFEFDALTTLNNDTGGVVDIILDDGQQQPTVVNGVGASTNFIESTKTLEINAPNIIDGSVYQIKNTTDGGIGVISFATVSGGAGISATLTKGVDYAEGDNIRVRIAQQSTVTAKEPIEYNVTAPANTAVNSNPVTQSDASNYNDHGVDGSTITGITWDSGNMQFDINDADNVIDGKDIGAWYYYFITTATGVDEVLGAVDWLKLNELVNCTSCVGITFDNTKTGVPLRITDAWWSRDDDATIIAATSNSIQIDPPAVFSNTVPTVQNVITGDIADVPAKTQEGLTAQGYTTGRAPNLDNLDAAVSTRATQASVDNNGTAIADLPTELYDTQEVESGVSVRQGLRAIAATTAGEAENGPSNSEFKAVGNPTTTRVTSAADENGDRTVTLNL